MAGPYNPPKKNQAFTFAIALADNANPGSFKSSPTLTAGDLKVDIDGAGFNNLATLPNVQPASNIRVRIQLSAAGTNGDRVTVECVDKSAVKEWADSAFLVLTGAVGEGGSGGLDAVGVRSAVGLAAANLDAQLTEINRGRWTKTP